MTQSRLSSPTGKASNKRLKLSWLWFVLLLSVLGIAFLPFPTRLTQPTERYFRIEANSFEYSPAIIKVNPGDRVTLELTSTDVVHGIYIDGYDLELRADPGQIARLSFEADRPGTFRFRCSVTCGALHPFMIGKLHVGPNEFLWKSLGLATLVAFAGLWIVKI